ncbi:hypothetical protein B0I18_107204 [Taibaiella chishuiensis]|uniref:Uncharacterized protein n=2 Tax=Taibaiella chishuiensis TaxID=1434707 RepID=A0A2P8D0P4_9BACT|nr:hypothetical protein B0I18_107204 [Taibaiella chishuiensis]
MLAVVGVAIGLLYACKRSGEMSPSLDLGSGNSVHGQILTKEGLGVSNGWLKFSSIESFNNTMNILHEKFQEPAKLSGWESGYNQKGFSSLRKTYEEIDADTSEHRKAPTVDSLIKTNQLLDCPDSWFATVLSKDGFIQIADTVYSFKPGNEKGEAYAIPVKGIKELLNNVHPAHIKGSKLHFTSFLKIPFIRWPEQGNEHIGPIRLSICATSGPSMPNFWGQSGGDIYAGDNGDTFPEHNGRTVKLNYHRWRVGYIFYASTGVRMKMWKHTRFAGWQSVTYADQMTMEACVKGYAAQAGIAPYPFTSSTSPTWPGFTKYAENNFEKTLKWVGSPIFSEILLEHFNFHFYLNYRGRIVERSIRQ